MSMSLSGISPNCSNLFLIGFMLVRPMITLNDKLPILDIFKTDFFKKKILV